MQGQARASTSGRPLPTVGLGEGLAGWDVVSAHDESSPFSERRWDCRADLAGSILGRGRWEVTSVRLHPSVARLWIGAGGLQPLAVRKPGGTVPVGRSWFRVSAVGPALRETWGWPRKSPAVAGGSYQVPGWILQPMSPSERRARDLADGNSRSSFCAGAAAARRCRRWAGGVGGGVRPCLSPRRW